MTLIAPEDSIYHHRGSPCDARTVLAHIGRGARMNLGIRDVIDLHDGIRCRVGIRTNQVLIVKLNVMDTYDLELARLTARHKVPAGSGPIVAWQPLAQMTDVYAEQLPEALIRLADGVLT